MYIYDMLSNMYEDEYFKKYLDDRPISITAIYEIIEERLSERDKNAIHLRFVEKMAFKSIGESIGVSGSRAKQIVDKAKRKIMHEMVRRSFSVNQLTKDYELLMFKHKVLEVKYEDLYKKYVEVCNKEDPQHIKYIDVPDISIAELNLSVRSYNCLTRAGYNNIRDLYGVTISQLLRIRNLGNRSLQEVIEKVKPYGITFAE